MASDPELTDQLVASLREWVAKEVIPTASAYEHADEYPAPLVDQMKAMGLFGATIPEEYGGLGLDTVAYARCVEELSYGWMSLAGVVNTHMITANLIKRFGTDEQKQHFLPPMATGTPRAAFSLSEPDAGSDTKAIRCKAVRDGDEFVLTGTKMWVTNGERAELVSLAARTEEGITCFLVEKEPGTRFGGITVSRRIDKLGYKGLETVEMTYDGHRVPAHMVLGGEAGLGRGLSYILSSLELGRVNIASRAVGVARAAFDAAMKYAQERETFGQPIAKHQAIGFKLADMATKLHAARLVTLDAAARFDRGERADVEAGMAKLFASETALELAIEAMRIHGGYGYTTEFPVERYYRDAPLMIIGEGTNEIQRMVIARGLLDRYAADRGGAGVTYSTYQHLKLERHGHVGWLINARPERLNAMNALMRDEFALAWRELDDDPEVRVIVHTGEGRAFQTGVDVEEIATDGQGMERYRDSVQDFDLHFTAWHQHVVKPVITAVNGLCAGGGFHWVADADIVICASDSEFFDPHVSIGQVVAVEAIGLIRKMPVEAVMRMALVGRYERISAQRAYELGMVSQIVDPPERLREEAQALAEKIAKNSPAAMAATKRALWAALEHGLTDACRIGAGHLVSMWGHPDQVEGPRAFAEKREAQWAPLTPEPRPDEP